MTTQLLATELTNLIQESKRKHNDLRQAAEKSLEELKGLRGANEAQAANELAQRPNFVNPFIVACGTKNAKFTGIAIVCLQRLIVARALPRGKLNQVLEALREATSAGLDVQLKILQALPSLLQNYATDLKGDLLITALNICFILQTSKNAIVNNTSAATLQQLVVSVFDKVVTEDKTAPSGPPAGEAPAGDGTVELRAAALDAHRIFNDLCLMTENQRPEYLRFSGLPQTFGLELIESVLTNHAAVFSTHKEQAHILQVRVMPFIISALKGKPNFATSVRLVRILYTLLRRHINILPSESGDALDILTHLLDQETAIWKRALCLEVFRGIFSEHALIRRIFVNYDAKEGEKDVLKHLTATFVRLSTEKPSVIGLGHQSTIPVADPYASIASSTDQAMLEASGVTGIISGSVNADGSNIGISTQWSTVRVPCIDQLDKTEAPSVPESYIYSLTLSCISSLSEGLAKFILPLTVPGDGRNRKRSVKPEPERDSSVPPQEDAEVSRTALERAASFKKNPVPLNPLALEDHPLHNEVKICATIIEECWPAILATCSTFLYAAMDSEYYHSLVRAFQKFAHVAGLLQLSTPRDAFLTTLGKAAVPPNVFTACLNAGAARPAPPTPTTEAPNSILSNARGLLSVDSLVTQSSPAVDRGRQQGLEASQMTLNTRNLLCLRALLNLGIALGPTLGSSWRIILETLQQADFVLFSTSKTPGRTPLATKGIDHHAESEANALLSNFGSEVRAVETAASRLIESTIDFPNDAFGEVVTAVCNLLERTNEDKQKVDKQKAENASQPQSPTSGGMKPPPIGQHRRVLSISTAAAAGPNQEDHFALAKLGDIATINIDRLLTYPPDVSGWTPLTTELIHILNSASVNASVRLRAAEILVRLALESANVAATMEREQCGSVQLLLLEALRDALLPLQQEDREVTVASHGTDVEIHKVVLEGLKNLLENCGETLVSGWEIAFEIIGSIFIDKKFAAATDERRVSQAIILTTRSAKLVRSSFNSLQLICSDFLASLPNSCFLILVDTLYKFCSQDDDLNIALTTVTFFWVLSDFLSGKTESLPITADLMQDSNISDLTSLAADPEHIASDAALWMLLLLRLTTVTADGRLELRNSAIQTLLRIFDAYGDKLSPEAWSICVKSVVFKLLSSIEDELQAAAGESSTHHDRREWHETAVVVLNGISELLASYMEPLSAHSSFNALWQELLGHFATLLDFKVLNINTATYKALGKVISLDYDPGRSIFDTSTVNAAWELWSRGTPISLDEEDGKKTDNQNCLIAYVATFHDVYQLVQQDLTVDQVRQMLTLFREALQQATVGAYVNDIEYVTPLQNQVLEAIKVVRTDLAGVPSAMISQVAEFVRLAFSEDALRAQSPTQRRTYVAMSKASMSILQTLVLRNASDADIYASEAFSAALSALSKPVVLKYGFPIVTKSTQPWRLATDSILAVLEATLPQMRALEVPRPTLQVIWQMIIEVANGIVSADTNAAPASADLSDDESFDIASFHKLRELIIPSLGAEAVPDKTRQAYAESLFRTSIIHAPSPTESSLIFGPNGTSDNTINNNKNGLAALYKKRTGRTVDPLPTRRDRMAYVCVDELFSLVSAYDVSSLRIVVQPPTPAFPPPRSATSHLSEAPQALHVRIARSASPFLILRAALTIRAYIADQPLRGRMPQPLSQRKELLRVLRQLVDLTSESDAIPDTPNVNSDGRKHLLRLYPLLVSAVQVAGGSGDESVLKLCAEALEVVGGELGV
ncbi:Putative mon2/Sec7/BIG1-like, dimerization and cyclophilin-binding domain-containing protein [Colletotrichum destructivum]|uniref:Mon2/Sec7/BIG1-like, dimerization and cyclophilin-binding domain-containing protein n=1 Tax=Colletotrichum destructivum TaxID=34406 RepID=A0AAX4IY57_9PEZI|nr:Putative mon2/Sec7/BIG1-like, dimerization and cyclophilin-binding domain-containing protein [Colletotrichum destructivum]